MASILQAKNISKSYGTKVLFENLDFNINDGDKIALIAPNGSGKSSLLKVLSGKDSSDRGGVVDTMRDIKVAYLEQEPGFDPDRTVFEEVFAASDILSSTVAEYESAIVSGDQKRIEVAIHQMDAQDAWQYELKVKQILTQLDIQSLNQPMGELSGGQKKRVAIAGIMIHEADLIILDEPTNHLDLIVIEFLEEYLKRTQATILMVTHDRYFLDRVCNHIIELENGKLYTYKGNYSYYLEKREERIENFNAESERARNLFRGELDWMRRMPQARATKAKYRINAFYDLKERAGQVIKDKNIKIDVGSSRLGTKIINCKGVSHYYTILPASGEIDRGETLVFGFYRQTGLQYDPEDTVVDVVRKIAEFVTLADGSTMPVTQFLSRFLFPHATHNTKVDRLSGGEKRRLYLVTVLMKNPNFLILDEPTNDLDIMSLNVLEEYLLNFQGCLLIVSHDRYFLDKLADHIFVFEGNGLIKDYVGKYTEYREQVKEIERETGLAAREAKVLAREKSEELTDFTISEEKSQKKKLSFKEQKELEKLEKDIDSLEKEKSSLEAALSSGVLSSEELTKSSVRIAEVIAQIDLKSDRWLELSS